MAAECIPTRTRGEPIRDHDWEQNYRNLGDREARLHYLRALGCFAFTSLTECAQLLEI